MTFLVVVVLMGVVGVGAAFYWQGSRVTRVSKILANPQDYDGKTVVVRGEVKQEASLLGHGGYLLADGDAQIWVVTNANTPNRGATVTVRGTVEDAASLLGKRLVILRESAPEKQRE
jgi:formylmethanofuran dehydrogenase subunit C